MISSAIVLNIYFSELKTINVEVVVDGSKVVSMDIKLKHVSGLSQALLLNSPSDPRTAKYVPTTSVEGGSSPLPMGLKTCIKVLVALRACCSYDW